VEKLVRFGVATRCLILGTLTAWSRAATLIQTSLDGAAMEQNQALQSVVVVYA
jgi:hypothetical protein